MITAVTAMYSKPLAAVPYTEARPTLRRGFFTRPAAIDAHSTPMNEKSATPEAMPMPS